MQLIKVHELAPPTCVLLLFKNFDPSLFFNVALSLSMSVDVLPPATRHGVPRTVICSKGYRHLQELDGKHREIMIYTGSVRRKITAPYV